MSQPTNNRPNPPLQLMAEALLACPEDQLATWLQEHQTWLTLPLMQYLKDSYVTVDQLQENPQLADRATRYGLDVAAAVPHEAEMLALAHWARGIWADFNDPSAAVDLYQFALAFYQAKGEWLSQARLLSNLVGVLAECGENQAAEQCYHQAYRLFTAHADADPTYLLSLEQNFGLLLYNWGRFPEALAVYDRAFVLATQSAHTLFALEMQVNRYLILRRVGRFDESEQGLIQASTLAAEHQQQLTVARIDLNLGELYTMLGRPTDALQRFQQAAGGFAAADNPMEQSVVLALQATLLRQLGAWRLARKHYQTALAILQKYNLQTMQGETLVSLAICLRLLGNKKQLQRATELLAQAQLLWTASGNLYWGCGSILNKF